jgi:uncharacterized membrane protein
MNFLARVKSLFSTNRKILLAILLLGIALRLYSPTFRSLWGDEVDSLFNAFNFAAHNFHFQRIGLGEIIWQPIVTPLKGYHLPAYYVLLSLWIQLFGAGEFNLRLLSIILAILSLPVMYLFAREMFDERTAATGTFLLSVSGMAVFYSQEIRPYSFMLLSALVASLFFWKMLKGQRGVLIALGYISSILLLSLSHLFGVLMMAAHFICLLLNFRREKDPAKLIYLLVCLIIAGLLIMPLYAKMLWSGLSVMRTPNVDLPYTVFPIYLRAALFFFAFSLGETIAPWNLFVVIPAVLIFGGLFLWALRDWRDERIGFLLVLTLFPILFSLFFIKLAMPKYMMICLPFYLLLIAYSLAKIKKQVVYCLILFLLFVTESVSVANYFTLNEYHNSNQIEPWRRVSSEITRNHRNGDMILTTNYFIVYRLSQYYVNIIDNNDYPVICLQKEDYSSNINDIQKAISSINAPRIWFVTHIADDRAFPAGYLNAAQEQINKRYRLVKESNYVPYKETLASQLPIKRHEPGSSRITLRLFVIK